MPEELKNLIAQMISPDPQQRPTIQQILNNPWLTHQQENHQEAAELVRNRMQAALQLKVDALDNERQQAI